jgi:glycosyltransferase involved in cell wall biosynthesis
MRVLQAIAELGSGGAEAVVEELTRRLLDEGHPVTLASAGGRREAALAAAGARVVRLPLAHRSAPGAARAAVLLAARVRRAPPDLVHAHNVGAAAVAHAGVRWPRRRPPLVVTFHGVADGDYPRAAGLLRRTADLVVAVSAATADRLADAGYPRETLHTIDNAVTPPPRADRAEARRSLGLADGVPVALCLARLVPQKRHDLLVAAFATVPAPAVLLVAGTGPLAGDVAAAAAAAGLGDRVRLLGERSDVPALLAAADVLCLASDWEGLPIAVLEAMSAGVPVVATAVDGLVAGVAGAARLVPPRDPAALGTALAAVLADPAERARLAAAGQARVADRYSPEAMWAAYRAVYADLLRDSVR